MAHKRKSSGVLPTHAATKEQTVVLVQSLLVTWKVLDHLKDKGVIASRESLLRALPPQARPDACCKPDGGTCCVNKKPE